MRFVMKKQPFWIRVAAVVVVGFLAYAGTARAQEMSGGVGRSMVPTVRRGSSTSRGTRNGSARTAPTAQIPSPVVTSVSQTRTASPSVTTVLHPKHIVDFDGDGKTDFSIIRDV